MRQPINRWTAVLAALVLLSAGMAWASGDEEGAAEGPATIRVSGYYEFNPNATSETLVMQWVGEATGTIIEPIHIARDDFGPWWNTRLASQDLPEIMSLLGEAMRSAPEQYGPQGLFVATDVERAEGRMPAYQAALDAWDVEGQQLFAPDGHAYGAHSISTNFRFPSTPGYALRGRLLEQAGYTLDPAQFSTSDDVLQAVLDTKPHFDALFGEPTFGMYNRGVRGIRSGGQIPRTLLRDEFSADMAMQMDPDNVWRFGPLNPRFKAGIDFLRTLHENGILHPDYLTMSEEDQSRASWAEGKMHFAWGTWLHAIEPTYYERLCGSNAESPYCGETSVTVVAPTVNGEQIWRRQGSPLGGRRVISGISDVSAKAVEVVDFLYTDEGSTLTLMGPEGYAWEYDDTPDNLWNRRWTLCWSGRYPKVECEENDPDRSKTRGEMIGENPLQFLYAPSDTWGMDWSHFYMDPADPDGTLAARMKAVSVVQEWVAELDYDLPKAIQFPFNEDELDEKVQLEGQIHTYVDEQITRFINGQNNMSSDWDEFIDRINTLGAPRLEQLYSDAMNRYVEAAGIKL